MPDRILVFIPCYNCAPQIPRVLRQLRAPVGERFTEILVLDNGSTDGTIEAAIATAKTIPRNITVARNAANYNLGGSHKAAFSYAEAHAFTHVLILHGDDQGNINDIVRVLENGLHRKYDACLGARFASGSVLSGYSGFRIFGNRVFNAFFTAGTMRSVKDLGSGLNIVSARIFRDPSIMRYADDLRFNIFLLLGLFDSGRTVMFFPISWREDDQISNVQLWSQAKRTLSVLADFVFRRSRFRNMNYCEAAHRSYQFTALFRSGADLEPLAE